MSSKFDDYFNKNLIPIFHKVVSRPIAESYVGRDFPRLVKNSNLYVEKSNQMVKDYEFDKSSNSAFIVSFLNTLGEVLNKDLFGMNEKTNDILREIEGSFVGFPNEKENEKEQSSLTYEEPIITLEEFEDLVVLDSHSTLTDFLIQKYDEKNSRVLKLLRFFDQAIVGSCLSSFNFMLAKEMEMIIKDIRGQWFVDFRKTRIPRKTYTITHQRTDQVCTMTNAKVLKEMFRMTWELEFQFDGYSLEKITDVHARIIKLDWEGNKRDEMKERRFRMLFGEPSWWWGKKVPKRLIGDSFKSIRESSSLLKNWGLKRICFVGSLVVVGVLGIVIGMNFFGALSDDCVECV